MPTIREDAEALLKRALSPSHTCEAGCSLCRAQTRDARVARFVLRATAPEFREQIRQAVWTNNSWRGSEHWPDSEADAIMALLTDAQKGEE